MQKNIEKLCATISVLVDENFVFKNVGTKIKIITFVIDNFNNLFYPIYSSIYYYKLPVFDGYI